jgi:hypothetical protein
VQSAFIYVPLCIVIIGNALLVKAIYAIHPFIYGSPAPPLLSRTPILNIYTRESKFYDGTTTANNRRTAVSELNGRRAFQWKRYGYKFMAFMAVVWRTQQAPIWVQYNG